MAAGTIRGLIVPTSASFEKSHRALCELEAKFICFPRAAVRFCSLEGSERILESNQYKAARTTMGRPIASSVFKIDMSHQEMERLLSELEEWYRASGATWIAVEAATSWLIHDLGERDVAPGWACAPRSLMLM